MRSLVLLAAVVLAEAACIPRPHERVTDPRFRNSQFRTIAIVAGGSRREHAFMADRARKRVRDAKVVNVVSVKGRWETEREIAATICGADKSPTLDGFVVVQGDALILWDCGTNKVAWEADGAYEGVDYMTKKLVEYLKSDG